MKQEQSEIFEVPCKYMEHPLLQCFDYETQQIPLNFHFQVINSDIYILCYLVLMKAQPKLRQNIVEFWVKNRDLKENILNITKNQVCIRKIDKLVRRGWVEIVEIWG